jgi:hypothetical protein
MDRPIVQIESCEWLLDSRGTPKTTFNTSLPNLSSLPAYGLGVASMDSDLIEERSIMVAIEPLGRPEAPCQDREADQRVVPSP